MENRFIKFNLANLVVIVVLSILCVVEIALLPVNSAIMPLLFAISVFCNLFYAFYAYQIAIKKQYNLINKYDENGRYSYEIFNYNVFSCNGIIVLATTMQNIVLLITYLALALTNKSQSIALASGIIFAICTLCWLVPVILKESQVGKYVKDTNGLFDEEEKMMTDVLEIPARNDEE